VPTPPSLLARSLRLARRSPLASLGVLIVGLVVIAALAAPLLATTDPIDQDLAVALKPPFWMAEGSLQHPLGTDHLGRDVFSRLVYGAQISLTISVLAALLGAAVGVAAGLVAGYLGGRVGTVIMRIVDLFFAFPFFVLVIAIVAMLGPSVFNMFVAIWLTSWISYARITRGHTLGAKRQEYTLAARALGYTNRRVVLRHILPNLVSYVIIFAMVDAVGNIVLGSSLGFLGLGAQPPSSEWGVMISDGQNYLLTAWWLSTFPGIAIILVGVGFSLIGDGLADILRPGD